MQLIQLSPCILIFIKYGLYVFCHFCEGLPVNCFPNQHHCWAQVIICKTENDHVPCIGLCRYADFFYLIQTSNQITKLTRFYLTFSECLILNRNKTMATLPCKIGPCMNHISHEVTVVPKFTLPNTLEIRVVYILWSCFSNCQGTEFCIVNK